MDFITNLGGGFIFRNRLREIHDLRTWVMVGFFSSDRSCLLLCFLVTIKTFFTIVERA
jgi:hypothetical protein